MNFYSVDIEELEKALKTDFNKGLSNLEVKNRLKKYGPNEIPKATGSFLRVYLAPLFNWLIVIYLIGAVILYFASIFQNESDLSMIYITLGIVFFNAIIAVFQQMRATKKLNALKALSAPTTVVIREGSKQKIKSKDLVVGDVILLQQGDRVPADCRLIEATSLEVDEASLTGESEPVKKKAMKLEGENEDDIPIGERLNFVFLGTFITLGSAKAVVVKIGGETEIGKISQKIKETGTSEIPIQKKMNNFGKWLGLLVMAFWLVTMLIIWGITGQINVFKSLNSAMDIMPINIPLLTTIVLLTGVLAMAKEGVIIRNLTSVDSLGRVSVVCSDKTGTLTQNQMFIEYIWNGKLYKVTGAGYEPKGDIYLSNETTLEADRKINPYEDNNLKMLLISGYLNNNTEVVQKEVRKEGKFIKKHWTILGSPTEGALTALYLKVFNKNDVAGYKEIIEYPFTSSLKRMSKVFKTSNGEYYAFSKGASEVMLPLCSKVIGFNPENEEYEEHINDEIKNTILNKVSFFASNGYRVLSLAYKKIENISDENSLKSLLESEQGRAEIEKDLTYLGFVTIQDPPRAGVKEAVKQCHMAGVNVVMITGDATETAISIAKKINIIESEEDIALEGREIEDYFEKNQYIDNVKVYSRVSPTHKLKIVEKFKSYDRIVGMTGDGVNDALALNKADAGIAMGIQGTDVAKEASDMVISDDSFISIVKGIEQGRGIFARIRAVVVFYIVINLFEGIVQFFLAVILNLPYFLDEEYYYQWIFLSITLHTFPGLILTFDTLPKDVLKEKPRDSEEILSGSTVKLMLVYGTLLAASMLIIYFLCYSQIYPLLPGNTDYFPNNDKFLYSPTTYNLYTPGADLHVAKTLTMLMTTLYFCESIFVYQIRRPNKSLWRSIKEDSNWFMYFLIGFLFFLYLSLLYIPGVQIKLASWHLNFKFMYLVPQDWLVAFLVSLITIGGFELYKYKMRKKGFIF
ncbi:MAG: cation-translocating P-type ATPase [Promethearchaeota archaeon]